MAKKAVVPAKKPAVKKVVVTLESRVAELEGDLVRLVNSIGSLLGEPFKSQGLEIVAKHQGKA